MVPTGIERPKTPMAMPNLPFSNHSNNRVDAETTARAPPTPSKNLQSCTIVNIGEKKHGNELKTQIDSPIIKNILTPYFPVKMPPNIDMKTPGKATSHMRLLAMVKLNLNSSIINGNMGGMACIEKIKENLVRKATIRAMDLPLFKSSKNFPSNIEFKLILCDIRIYDFD